MKAKKKSIMQTLREIRDKQSEKYYNNPELLKQDLKKIRKKYHTSPQKENTTMA
jgi:hypothetical protein